jgi:hypothetical protein
MPDLIGSKMVANSVLFSLAPEEMLVISTAGRVAEWFKAAVLKTARAREGPRGFESLPFRQFVSNTRRMSGALIGLCSR